MNKVNKDNVSRGGFTLIELLVVISIIVILMTIIVGVYFSAKSRSEEKKARAEMKAIELAIHNFYTDNSYYPPDSVKYVVGVLIEINSEILTKATEHGFSDSMAVKFWGTVPTADPEITDPVMYVRTDPNVPTTAFTLHRTVSDAKAGLNAVNFTAAGQAGGYTLVEVDSLEKNGLFDSLTQGSSMLSRMDTNGDGKISKFEYNKLYKKHPERVQQIMGDFGEVDTNGDGFIDSAEQEVFRKGKKNYLEGAQVKADAEGNLIASINHPDPEDDPVNYWLYNSSDPKNNPDSFDLYVFLRTDVDAAVEMNSTIRTEKLKARMYLGNWPGDYMYEKYDEE